MDDQEGAALHHQECLPFGTQAGDILQFIDVKKGLLNNVIMFPPSGIFFVRSSIEAEPPQRINFRFASVVLRESDWEIPSTPFGQGQN